MENKIIEQFKQILKKDNQDTRLESHKIISHMFNAYGPELSDLYIRWSLSHFIALQMPKTIELFNKIYKICKERNIEKKNMYDYNDLDNAICIMPAKNCKRRVLCIETQNINFLFIIDEGDIVQNFHIRRYWYKWKAKDEWDKKEESRYKKYGINEAIRTATWIVERYADDIPGNKYIYRPSLNWFAKNDFNLKDVKRQQYGDARDSGYIMSYESWSPISAKYRISNHEKVDEVIHEWYLVMRSLKELEYALENLEECDD